MSDRSPVSDSLVQWFVFDDAASDDDDADLAAVLFRLTPLQREQVRWGVENRILKERGLKLAHRLELIGRREYGDTFAPATRHALTDAVRGNAGPHVTAAADGLFERMTADEKARFYPPEYWG